MRFGNVGVSGSSCFRIAENSPKLWSVTSQKTVPGCGRIALIDKETQNISLPRSTNYTNRIAYISPALLRYERTTARQISRTALTRHGAEADEHRSYSLRKETQSG